MHVLHVLDHSIPLHSGYTFRTLAILREQRKLGWATSHLTSPKHAVADAADEEEVDGLHFWRTPWRAQGLWRGPLASQVGLMRALERRLEEVVGRVRPDILQAHSPVLNAIPALRVGRRHGIPVVYEIRAFWEDAAVDHGTTREGSPRYRLSRALETLAVRRAQHVTTICEGLRADIAARGIPADRISVIPNAVDVESFASGAAPDEELRSRLGLQGCDVVGFIGSFYAYEGLDMLVDAMPLLAARRRGLRLLLVGGGPQEEALKARVKQLGLDNRVVFAGRVPHGEVQRYYDLIDILAYPRRSMRLTELVTPLKPLEAMAQGRIFVASDVGGHRELIRHGETGTLFRAGSVGALADAVSGLFQTRQDWPRLRQAGRRFVESDRTWANSVRRYAPVFERLTSQRAVR
jgi:PEP-CTERM/exosortase A-associated glycosyltransferase